MQETLWKLMYSFKCYRVCRHALFSKYVVQQFELFEFFNIIVEIYVTIMFQGPFIEIFESEIDQHGDLPMWGIIYASMGFPVDQSYEELTQQKQWYVKIRIFLKILMVLIKG